jgi:hypothetical protein
LIGSTLLRNDNAAATSSDGIHFVCSQCGDYPESGDVFEQALDGLLGLDVHEAAKEGFMMEPFAGSPLIFSELRETVA